jgi:hypothetical protein
LIAPDLISKIKWCSVPNACASLLNSGRPEFNNASNQGFAISSTLIVVPSASFQLVGYPQSNPGGKMPGRLVPYQAREWRSVQQGRDSVRPELVESLLPN